MNHIDLEIPSEWDISLQSFDDFLTSIANLGYITEDIKNEVDFALEKNEWVRVIQAAVKIEVAYLSIVTPAFLLATYHGYNQSMRDISVDLILFVLFWMTVRTLASTIIGTRAKIKKLGLFTALQLIPHIGRYTPLLWLRGNGEKELFILRYIYSEYKARHALKYVVGTITHKEKLTVRSTQSVFQKYNDRILAVLHRIEKITAILK